MADRQILRQQRSSLIAAAATGDASGELLRFHMEGARCNWPFGDEQPVAKLAEALLRTARIEDEILACQPSAAGYRSDLGQLAAACAKFLTDQTDGIPLDLLEDIHESEVPY